MSPALLPFEFECVCLDEQGNIVKKNNLRAQYVAVELSPSITLEMVEIPGGNFVMGARLHETEARENETPAHLVKVNSFFLGKFPVTQKQWLAIMPKLPQTPDAFCGEWLPVVNVWLEQALEFCERLFKITGLKFRLPSEAEWEYACRAGTIAPFHFGTTITTDLVNFNGDQSVHSPLIGKFRQRTTPINYFKAANAFGLYDMHGNVWEWCGDVWYANYENAPTDGKPWIDKGDQSYCVQRGGSWRDRAGACRSAFRVGDVAHNNDNIVGLRVCSSTID